MRKIGVLVAALIAAIAVSPRTAAHQQTIEDRVQALEALHGIGGGGPTGPPEVALELGVMDLGQYGTSFGSNEHPKSIFATFTGVAGTEYELTATGWDIDFADEVLVFANGPQIGAMSVGPNESLNSGDAWTFTGIDGENRIEFRQKTVGWKWGVADMLVDELAPPPPPPPPSGSDLSGGVWNTIPSSSMDQLYDPAIDGSLTNFSRIQEAWSGGACYEPVGGDAEMVIVGGGHGDSDHNGVFALNTATGQWRRVTMPSPTWSWDDSTDPNYCAPEPGQPESKQSICTPPAPWSPCPWEGCRIGPDGLPHSRHSYDGLEVIGDHLYIIDGGTWPGAGGSNAEGNVWRVNLQTGAYEALAYMQTQGQAASAAVLPDGRIAVTVPQWKGRVYDPSSDTWSIGNLSNYVNTNTMLTYVPTTDSLFAIGSGAAREWPAASFPAGGENFYTAHPAELTHAIGADYYPPDNSIVVWAGGRDVHALDPVAKTWSTYTLLGDDPGPQKGEGVFGRFRHCGGRLVLVNGVDADMQFIDVAEPVALAPPEPAVPVAETFEERCADPNTVLCRDLDDDIPGQSWWRNWEGWSGSATVDREVKSHGTGSLRFTIAPGERFGDYAVNFSEDGSADFGPGEAFAVEYKVRYDCAFIFEDGCAGARRLYRRSDGGWTSAKLSIVGRGDTDVRYDNVGSCTSLELVVNYGRDHSLAVYHACGWYEGLTTYEQVFGKSQSNWQPGGDFECLSMPEADHGSAKDSAWGFTGPNCWRLPAEQWVSIRQEVYVGPAQRDRKGEPASRFRLIADGEVVVDHVYYNAGPDEKLDGVTAWYGKVWLLPYMTGKDLTEKHPTAYVWYDELTVRRLEA